MSIDGLLKMTLLDYPGYVAATIFFGGCNFFCPYCHNKDLVISTSQTSSYSQEDVILYLSKRKPLLDGVCISGGEPTLQKDLAPFLVQIKALGYKIKLDTNGSNPDVLMNLYHQNLLDYVAMDIKHTPDKYPLIINQPNFDIGKIKASVSFLKKLSIPYEFRTTVVSEFHKKEDFEEIGEWLKGADSYFLQCYKDSDNVISPGFHAPKKEDLITYADLLQKKIKIVKIRGVDL